MSRSASSNGPGMGARPNAASQRSGFGMRSSVAAILIARKVLLRVLRTASESRRRASIQRDPAARLPSPQALALGLDEEWRKTRERILARDGYRCSVHVRPGERCEGTKLLEVHHVDGGGDVLLVPDSELRTVCRKHNPRGG
jgi:hypothetical protein